MISTILERTSKGAVVVSACVAVICGAWLGAREWPPLMPMTIVLLLGGAAAGRVWGTRVWIPVLFCAYLVPAMFVILHGSMGFAYWMPWIAALLGGVAGNLDYRGWAFPARWKWPLAYWALAVALVWPAVVAREADFTWALMYRYNLANSALGGPPPVIALWIVTVALTYMVGLLWLDASFSRFRFDKNDESLRMFLRDVASPLAAGVVIGSAVAIYQGTIDINWLSGHQWPFYNRATGSLDDGNAFGAVAGFWVGGFLALGAASRRPMLRAATVLGACAAFAGLWMTGSRMALLAALIPAAFGVWFAITARKWTRRDFAVAAVSVAGVLAVVTFFALQSSAASPLARIRSSLPGFSVEDWRRFVGFELWNRFGPFGSAWVAIMNQYPVTGVGVGSFNHIFPDYAFILTGTRAHMDNAQSWYRHELAELGVLGSLGWLVWVPMFGLLLARTRADADKRFAATMIRGSLVAVAVVSFVSMPTQGLPVAFTVWVLVFWYLLLSKDAANWLMMPAQTRSAIWPAVVWLLTLSFVAATLVVGWRRLRPPYRAIRADWNYQVGFSGLDTSNPPHAFRWTERHAIQVFPVTGRWLKLTVSGGPPDIAERPVALEIKREGKTIITVTRNDVSPMTWYVAAPVGPARMMLEFTVSRTWQPADYGATGDRRELGVSVDDWTFVDSPPSGAVVIR